MTDINDATPDGLCDHDTSVASGEGNDPASGVATPVLTLPEIKRLRVERGVCRHCGGPVPCSSEFGDQRVGVRHSIKSWRKLQEQA